MDLKYLQTFYAIVEEGSFSKAAKKLNYTQSTITFHIGQLEKDLKTPLFEKIGRRMMLTKAGEELIPYVKEVLSSIEKMQNFRSDLNQCRGELKIGAPETLLCFCLPIILKEFHEKAPLVRLSLVSMNSRNVNEALREDRIDIGVFYNRIELKEDIDVYPFGTYHLIAFASPQIKQAYPDFITPNQQFPLLTRIVQPMPGSLRRTFDEYLHKKQILLGNTIEVRNSQIIKNLARNDMGVCFLPKFAVTEELERGELVEIPTDMNAAAVSAVYGRHKNKWVSPAMQLFMDLLQKHADGSML